MPPKVDRILEVDSKGSSKYSESVLQSLKMAYGPYAFRILAVLVLGLMGRILLLGSSNVIGVWVDSYCQKPLHCHSIPTFFSAFSALDYVKVLAVMTSLGFIMTLLFRTLFSRLSALVISGFYDEVTWRTSRLPMSFMDRTPAGRIITRFSSDYGNVFRLFGGPLAEFIAIVFDLLTMIFLMGVASPYFLIFIGIIVVFNFIIYRLNRNTLRKSRRELSASRSPSIAHFAETAQGASTIRTFSKQTAFESRFTDLDHFFLNQKLDTVRKLLGFSFQMNSLSALLFLLTGLGSIQLLESGSISLGSLGVAFGLIVLSGNTVQMFFEWLAQFEEAMIGVERLDEYLRKPIELGNFIPSKSKFPTGHPRQDANFAKNFHPRWNHIQNATVEFKNVSFKYTENSPWILNNLSFKIEAGEQFGIIGTTGSGKSTIIQVLFHLYPHQQGEIFLQGQKLNLLSQDELGSLDSFRSKLSYISQDPNLFQGLLRDNLDMNHQATDQEMQAALDQVGLKDWSLESLIEERGKNLSSGERQLICMARCLLQKSPVVIMDEATSFVDPQSEEIMVQATRNYFKGRTQIIIAHRLSTLKQCDRILWLDQGQLKMIGTAQEVLSQINSQPQFAEITKF